MELDGAVLAETADCVTLFETGLPTRYYLDRANIDGTRLRHSDTVTRCPYKGTTSSYWSSDGDDERTHPPRSPRSPCSPPPA